MPEYQETKRVPCRCGGKALLLIAESKQILGNRVYSVICDNCRIRTDYFSTAEEACKCWNNVMAVQSTNVKNIEHVRGYPMEGECENCGIDVTDDGEYCPGCGRKLVWK